MTPEPTIDPDEARSVFPTLARTLLDRLGADAAERGLDDALWPEIRRCGLVWYWDQAVRSATVAIEAKTGRYFDNVYDDDPEATDAWRRLRDAEFRSLLRDRFGVEL